MASGGTDESDFDGVTTSDREDFNDIRSEIGSDISVSLVSTPDVSETDLSESDWDDGGPNSEQEWKKKCRAVNVDNFGGRAGSKINLGPLRTEKYYFVQFFPDPLVEKIVVETKNYARRMTEQKPDSE